ncbi:DUF6507 family protein [Streptomyces sp. NPDC048156]|uniref:DUF6507 family protein n=1 Tax=Streptomyces sp. NPDC048156 TaxID=3365502 RepID=UPI00371ADBC9
MTGWDISSSGVEFVTGLVETAMDDMAKDIKAYGKDIESAAAWAGTISGAYCGAAPTGPVKAALSVFVNETLHDVLFLSARAAKSVNGARQATGYYILGHLEMAANAQHKALSAPKVDLPGQGGDKGHGKEGGKK